jgi:hypothetical protein
MENNFPSDIFLKDDSFPKINVQKLCIFSLEKVCGRFPRNLEYQNFEITSEYQLRYPP